MVVELLLDVWDSAVQEALWGLHASLRSLCIWCEESHHSDYLIPRATFVLIARHVQNLN